MENGAESNVDGLPDFLPASSPSKGDKSNTLGFAVVDCLFRSASVDQADLQRFTKLGQQDGY